MYMNWLAHIFLAQPTPESRLGNLLGDLVKGKAREKLDSSLQPGLKCHQAIDIFTDSHSVVKCSRSRISSEYRRFAGILIDVFYDHFLAHNWQDYSPTPLDEFTTAVYASFESYLDTLPIYASSVISRLIAEDWLGGDRDLVGIENTLARIEWKLSRRRNRPYKLTPAIEQLIQNYTKLEQDFREFFPQLILHINHWHQSGK